MNIRCQIALSLGLLLHCPVGLSAQSVPASDAALESRAAALDLAGAFQNDGFKIRDGYWSGELTGGESQLVVVHLYAGNAYWFLGAAGAGGELLTLSLFDANGQPVETLPYQEGSRAGAGFIPEFSGKYLVRLTLGEGVAAPVCLLYAYK